MIRSFAPSRAPGIAVATPTALPGQRIGIMGGSFNPPHEGHLIVARTALRVLRLDTLWWLVTPGNPLKDHGDLAPLEERMAQVQEFATNPRMHVTAFEAQLDTPYTAATLAFLKNRFPQVQFTWVMGADNLASFHRWQQWRTITASMPIAVIDRPGWHLRALASPAARAMANARIQQAQAATLPSLNPPAWAFLTTRLSKMSSTELRTENAQKVRKRHGR